MKKSVKKSVKFENSKKDISIYIYRYFWIVIPVLSIVYFLMSKISIGFYQDDEISQYLNMLQFWKDPFVILGNNPKPGYKIFMVVPALFGYNLVLLINSFIASLSVFFTFKLIKVYNINFAFFGATLLSIQPLFFDLSFRSYSEIFTSLCIVFFLILYKKEYYLISAILCGYIFTIRQEFSIFCLILGFIFIKQKKIREIFAIGIFPILYNLFGYLKTGDIFYILTEMKNVAALTYQSQGFFHYFKVYIFIVGPVSISLFLSGFFGFLADSKKIKKYIAQYLLFYLIFITVFAVQVYTMLGNGPNPGNWRYLLHISPICAVFATIGFNNLRDNKQRNLFYVTTGILIFLTFAFLSKPSDGFILLNKTDYKKFIFLLIILFQILVFSRKDLNEYLKKLSISLLLTAVIYLSLDFEPKKLSSENITIKNTVTYLNTLENTNRNIYCNHTLLFFFSENYKNEIDKYKSITYKNLSEASKGSLVVWDSHYGYRKEWGLDVDYNYLKNNSDYKFLKNLASNDGVFSVFVFEKIN